MTHFLFIFIAIIFLLELKKHVAATLHQTSQIDHHNAIVRRADNADQHKNPMSKPNAPSKSAQKVGAEDRYGVLPSDDDSSESNGFIPAKPSISISSQSRGNKNERQIQRNSSWGLSMISHKEASETREYVYNKAVNKNVMIYIIDSGCLPDHEEYKGRMRFNVDHSQFDPKILSHGTSVASIAGGNRLGVAKDAELVSVSFRSYFHADLEAMDWVLEDIQKPENRNKKAVINISEEVRDDQGTRERLKKLLGLQIPLVLAAGNNETNECDTLGFLKHELIVLVSSVDEHYDKFTPALYGECIDVLAPGGIMEMADSLTTKSYVKDYGTSLAAPYVSGVIAYLWGQNSSLSSQEVIEKAIHSNAKRVKEEKLQGTPNFLVYNGAA